MKEKSRLKPPSVRRSQTIKGGWRKSNINVQDMEVRKLDSPTGSNPGPS